MDAPPAHAARTPTPATPWLNAVDQQVQELRSEVAIVRESVESQAQSLAAESQAGQRAIAISTYGQIAAARRQGSDSVFIARSFELVFSGQPHESISFFSELEFERAATVGGDRGGEVLLEQAYIDYAFGAELAFRAGVLLVPSGNNEADHCRAADVSTPERRRNPVLTNAFHDAAGILVHTWAPWRMPAPMHRSTRRST